MAEEQGDCNQIKDAEGENSVKEYCTAKQIFIPDIYNKLHLSQDYDIVDTNLSEIYNLNLTFKTEQHHNIFLLHLFVNTCNNDDLSYMCVSSDSLIVLDNKLNIAHLPSTLKEFTIKKKSGVVYITTYSFCKSDVQSLVGKKLCIYVKPLQRSYTLIKKYKSMIAEHHFGQLLSDPACSDFVIESMDGERFSVHKVVLTVHSAVFRAMLKEDTAESQQGCLKLVDVGKEDLGHILQYLYKGNITDIENCNCINLLMLADKYELMELRKLLQYVLSQQITHDNVLELLVIADMSNAAELKAATLRFVKKNTFILQSDIFREVNNAELLQELCKYLTL